MKIPFFKRNKKTRCNDSTLKNDRGVTQDETHKKMPVELDPVLNDIDTEIKLSAEEKENETVRMVEAGATYSQIEAKLGVHPPFIIRIKRKYNIGAIKNTTPTPLLHHSCDTTTPTIPTTEKKIYDKEKAKKNQIEAGKISQKQGLQFSDNLEMEIKKWEHEKELEQIKLQNEREKKEHEK